MMRLLVCWLLLVAAAFAIGPAQAVDATGTIAGTVRDADTLEPIEGARVNSGDTTYWQFGAWTNADGSYVVENMPVGTYPFDSWCWGYDSVRVENVSVTAGQTTTVDFLLPRLDPTKVAVPLLRSVTGAWQLNGDTREPVVTPDGRYVAFASDASDVVAGDTNGQQDIFLLDRETEEVTLISKAADGTQSNGYSYYPSISADGRYVAYGSKATNLLPEVATAGADMGYVYDRETGTLTLATVGDGGVVPDGYGALGAISADGRHYYFGTPATNLDPTDSSDRSKLFVRNLESGRTWRVDIGLGGAPADHSVGAFGLTPDGRYLLLDSDATNLVPDDTNGTPDQFVYDVLSGTMERADVADDESQAVHPTDQGAAMSADGRYVAFSVDDQDFAPDLVHKTNVFVRDRVAGTTELVGILKPDDSWSQTWGIICLPMSMNADGRFVVFNALQAGTPSDAGPVSVRDRVAAVTATCPLGKLGGGRWVISGNGRSVIANTSQDYDHPITLWLWEPALLSFGTLQGTVRDDTGAPVPHADVWIGDALYTRADAAGAFSIDVSVTASTTVRVSAEGYAGAMVQGLAISEGEATPVEVTLGRQFSDVETGSWADASVSACLEAGIVTGYADGSYHPSEGLTRGQMAVYIARALAGGDGGVVPPRRGTQSFGDVSADHWAYRYIESCFAEGAVQGYPNGSYQPDQAVNRGQMAVYIARAMVSPTGDAAVPDPPTEATFPDVTAESEWSWCYPHVEYLAAEGIVQGYWDGYHPEREVTRDQMAAYIQRAFELPM